MNISILELVGGSADQWIVSFSTRWGNGRGIWYGSSPERSDQYDVEFDIPDTLDWGLDIIETQRESYTISVDGAYTVLVGKVETHVEGNLISIRLGDSLVSALIDGDLPAIGIFVDMRIQHLGLFDTHT